VILANYIGSPSIQELGSTRKKYLHVFWKVFEVEYAYPKGSIM